MKLNLWLIIILAVVLASSTIAVYIFISQGAIFIFGLLICGLSLLVLAALSLYIRYKRGWLLPLISVLGALLLFNIIGGCTRLYWSWYWIHHDPDSYPDGCIVQDYLEGNMKITPGIAKRDSQQQITLVVNCSNTIQKGGGLILRLGKIIPVGGQLRFYDCFYKDMWNSALQVDKPDGHGYVSIHGPQGVEFRLSKPPAPEDSFIVHTFVRDLAPFRADASKPVYYSLNAVRKHEIHVKIDNGAIVAGEDITFVLGDTGHGGPGWRMPGGEADTDFIVYADTEGNGKFRMLKSYVTFQVGGGPMASMDIIAPSTPDLRENFTITVRAVDDKGFVSLLHEGTVKVLPQDGLIIGRRDLEFKKSSSGIVEFEIEVMNPGTYRLRVQDNISGKVFASNPIWVQAQSAPHIYWGDLHQHTTLGKDANRTPAWVYEHNKKVDRFDFAAISIHDLFDYWCVPPTNAEFMYLQNLSDAYNAPDVFVTVKGYEWTSFLRGHRNVYYDEKEHPEIVTYAQADRPDLLRQIMGNRKYIVIPHHTAWRFLYEDNPNDWGIADWKEMRLAEIYSKHGSSDYFEGMYPIHHDKVPYYFYLLGRSSNRAHRGDGSYVREALAAGYRMGIIAGGDNHWARGGHGFGTGITADYPGGLQAVYAPTLTRNDLYYAMWKRCTYGTTGARIIIDFTIDGYPMGSEIIKSGNSLDIRFCVRGTAPIKQIELWKFEKTSGYCPLIFSGAGRWDVEQQYSERFNDENIFYFLHVVQEDGQLAWSSPIWVDKRR